jgi:SnoaL-like domain
MMRTLMMPTLAVESMTSRTLMSGVAGLVCLLMAFGMTPALASSSTAPKGDVEGFKAMVRTQYDAIIQADPTKFASVYSPDAFVLGPVSDEVVGGRGAVEKVVKGLMLEPGSSKEATTVDSEDVAEGFKIGMSPDAACAWTYDQIAVTTPAGFGYFRIATLAEHKRAGWQVVAQSWSCPISEADEAFSSNQFIKPLPMIDSVGPGAESLGRSVSNYVELARWDAWNGRTDTFFVGPGLNHAIVVGDQNSNTSARSSLERWRIKRGTGGTFARLVCGGAAGFASYNVTYVDKDNDHTPYPMRSIEFYSRDGGTYRRVLVQTGATIRKLNKGILPVL